MNQVIDNFEEDTFLLSMDTSPPKIALYLSLLSLAGFHLFTPATKAASTETGMKGAKVYCYMRDAGNSHEVSWSAAYEVVKRQTNGLFKTSPKHAAVLITEAVVQEPTSFDDCGTYIGDLFGGTNTKVTNQENNQENTITKTSIPSDFESEDRYSY